MEHLSRFDDYKYNGNNMINEEWRLLPTYQDTIKRKLSFLKIEDLSKLEPVATHQMEIKALWRKLMKKMNTKDKSDEYITIVDNYDVHHLTNPFEIIKSIKDSLINKKDVGYILYHPEMDKFFYEKAIVYP